MNSNGITGKQTIPKFATKKISTINDVINPT